MGRRKKEPEAVHRANIASAAERLFERKGIGNVTVDEIAKEAGYSKATVYVYFKNKEEIVDVLALKSMKLLQSCIRGALAEDTGIVKRYLGVCDALRRYQEQSPFYFEFATEKLRTAGELPVEQEIYETGEEINAELAGFLQEGIAQGAVRPDIAVLPTVFFLWASLAGVIRMADRKRQYFEEAMGMSEAEFLEEAYRALWRSVAAEVTG